MCQTIQTASAAVQGVAALEGLVGKCLKGYKEFGSDCCRLLPQPALTEIMVKSPDALEHQLLQISEGIINGLQTVGDDTEAKGCLAAILVDVNRNLARVRELRASLKPAAHTLPTRLVKFNELQNKFQVGF